MGKKNKKTRWRTLTLNGHQSDSEESSSKSSLQTSKGYQHKYSKFPYSSQSSPIRKFQHESSKSTRSNSTTSEYKTTFNEDEYTRITTPRQDVLFKKGYLSKPKTYQTQTSTGTSSTANSTSTCTPDHQSADGTEGTDLEYESQFVFPNGFIDRNGIYYVNSFEPFPFVVYNAPICYPEYPNTRSKRYSTDSMAESVSPHNEEVGQEIGQTGAGERINNTPVFTQTYMQPAFYFNGVNTLTNGQYTIEEARRFKKRRRRKISRSKSNHDGETSQDTDDYASSDEVFSQSEGSNEPKTFPNSLQSSTINQSQSKNHPVSEHPATEPKLVEEVQSEVPQVNGDHSETEIVTVDTEQNENPRLANGILESPIESSPSHSLANLEGQTQAYESGSPTHAIDVVCEEKQTQSQPEDRLQPSIEENRIPISNSNDAQNLLLQSLLKSSEKHPDSLTPPANTGLEEQNNPNSISDPQDCNEEANEAPNLDENKSEDPNHQADTNTTYSLKPDAEEFIPRTFRAPEAFPFDPNVQFLNLPPNFIPIPFVNHLGELQQPPFLPPGIPLNFVPSQDPKLIPNFINIVPNDGFPPKTFNDYPETEVQDQDASSKPADQPEETSSAAAEEEKPKDSEISTSTEPTPVQPKKPLTKNEIDIAKIVYKLEEAAKQQRVYETKQQSYSNRPSNKYSSTKPYPNQRTRYPNRHYQENHYSENRYQRGRPDSLEKQYERKYRRPDQGFRRERSKPNIDPERSTDRAKSESRIENPTPQELEERLQPDEPVKIPSRQSTPVRNSQVQQVLERKMEPRNHYSPHKENTCQKQPENAHTTQQKLESDENHVNNVNTRIAESCSMIKDLKLEGAVNYSETVKKKVDVVQKTTKINGGSNTKCQRSEKYNSEKTQKKPEQKLVQNGTLKPLKGENQWISVSSRKRRKNKMITEEHSSLDEPDHEEQTEESQNDDHLFETFDVNLLEDVVPPSKLIEVTETELIFVQDTPTETTTLDEPPVPIKKEEYSALDINENSTAEEPAEESAKAKEASNDTQEIKQMLSVDHEEPTSIAPKDNSVPKPKKKLNEGGIIENKKKKSKKGTQKPLTKRIIITDVNVEVAQTVPKQDSVVPPEPQRHVEEQIKEETVENLTLVNYPNTIEEQPAAINIPKPINVVEDSQVSHTEEINVQSEETQNLSEIIEVATAVITDVPKEYVKETFKCEEINTEETTNKLVEPVLESLSSSSSYQTQTSESDTLTETPEKKSKKKKKKSPKPTLVKIPSEYSSNTTLNNLDDSYDFLLETSILEDAEQKTNVEMSQELDRMIQKGMYSSLEEKIRTLKISAAEDGFFKTINYGVLQNQAAAEKSSVIKAANFGKMLRNTTQLLRMPKNPEEIDQDSLINIDFSDIKLPDLEPQPSTSKSGIFLDNPEVNELIKNATNNVIDPSLTSLPQKAPLGKTKNNGKLKNKSKKNHQQPKTVAEIPTPEVEVTVGLTKELPQPQQTQKGEEQNGTIHQESNLTTSNTFSSPEVEPPLRKSPPKQDSLYPITQAVKDWMTRTHENTPDVEILKSPNTIYKELYQADTETESDSTGDSKNEDLTTEKGFDIKSQSRNGLETPRPTKSVSRGGSPISDQFKNIKASGKRVDGLSHTGNDDEITIWSVSPQNSVEEDLLDCWENELVKGCEAKNQSMTTKSEQNNFRQSLTNGLHSKHYSEKVHIQNGGIREIKGSVQNGHQAHMNGHVEEGEEAIEVYESKYGKNEDFLKLKAEIEEQQNSLNFPKHGNLPYRAICCSIM